MKIKSLLAGISVLALSAGSASALDFRVADVNGAADSQDGGNVGAPGNPVLLANETDNSGITGTFEFEIFVSAGAAFPAGANVDVNINLPTGVTFGAGGANAGDVFNGTNGSVTGASLTSGGAAGSSTVRLLVSIDNDQAQPRETIGFQVPLVIADAGCDGKSDDSVDITITAQTEIGTPIDGGTATGAIIECTDALVGDVDSDEATDDSFIALLNDYNDFGDVANPGGGAATTTLGTVEYTADLTAITSIGANTAANTTFVVADVDELTFGVLFEDATGIAGVTVDGVAGVQSGNVFTVALDDTSAVFGAPVDIDVTADGDAATFIATQSVVVTNAVLTYDNANLATETEQGSPGSVFCGHGTLDFLQREGREFGFFDWVAEAGAVNTLFRVTGLSTTEDTPYSVTFANSNTGQNLTASGTIMASSVANGELVMSSRDQLAALNPGYSRADVFFIFETNNDLDVDRLISTSGFLTDFGDGANVANFGAQPNTPNNDDDDNNLTE